MSAAHASQVRRPEAAAPARPAQQPMRTAFAFAAPSADDEIRLNLSDIPLMKLREEMDVEGFKPSLLSRLFDLVAPLGKR